MRPSVLACISSALVLLGVSLGQVASAQVAPVAPQRQISEIKLSEMFQSRSIKYVKSPNDELQTFGYRVLLPDGFDEDKTRQFPIVLFLHGAGERGSDNVAQLKHVAAQFAREDRRRQFPAIVLFPQCPVGDQWAGVPWTPATGKGTFPSESTVAMSVAMSILGEWLDSGRVDRSRVYIAGLSMGGYGTWYAIAQPGHPFAAAIPICGGSDPEMASRYLTTPIWAFHGSADPVVPVSRTREIVTAIETVAMAAKDSAVFVRQCKYTEYEGGSHDVWTQTFQRDDVFEWLFDQRK